MADTDATRALGTEPVGSLLLRYSLPAITSMVVFSLYNIVDSIFIGHGVGPLGIAGLAVTFPIMNLSIACSLLVGIGGASIISILLGQGRIKDAQRVLGNVLILGILIGVLFGGVMLLFLDEILTAFGASPDTLPYARDFMRILLFALPIPYTLFGLNHLMRATGYPQKALISALCTVGVNILLAPLFIFVFEWGMQGAALATTLAQVVGMVWVLHHFRNPNSTIHFMPGIYRLRFRIVKSIFSIGLAPFLLNVCASAVVAVINTGLRHHGGDLAIGAYGIVNRVLFVFLMIVTGLAQGMQPIIGYNHGAKETARVKQTLKYGLISGGLVTTTGMALAMLIPGLITGMFTDDSTLRELAITGLRIGTLAFPLVGVQIVISNFFQSMGMASLSIFLSLTRQLLFLIPFLLVLPRYLGIDGIWYSLPASDLLAFIIGVLILLRFLNGQRQLEQ